MKMTSQQELKVLAVWYRTVMRERKLTNSHFDKLLEESLGGDDMSKEAAIIAQALAFAVDAAQFPLPVRYVSLFPEDEGAINHPQNPQ